MSSTFREMLEAQWDEGRLLCVGLDPDLAKIPVSVPGDGPGERILAFNRAIIDATKDIVGAFKPNSAFYEAYGAEGWKALKDTIAYIKTVAPGCPVILDVKRADIGNTNDGYVRAFFDDMQADAVTVHPYLGKEALEPFLARTDKGIIVLIRTSNGGAGEFQDLTIEGEPLYLRVTRNVVASWNENGNCALVVGATYPEELKAVRAIAPDMPILIPGIGAQGGDVSAAVANGRDARGKGIILNASRAIIYASSGADFAEAARTKARELDDLIRKSL